jgi:hypothetical protein
MIPHLLHVGIRGDVISNERIGKRGAPANSSHSDGNAWNRETYNMVSTKLTYLLCSTSIQGEQASLTGVTDISCRGFGQ